jgi:hypothetical protein
VRPAQENLCGAAGRHCVDEPGVKGVGALAQLAHVAQRQQPAPALGRFGARQDGEHGANRHRVGVVALVQKLDRAGAELQEAPRPAPRRGRHAGERSRRLLDIRAQRLGDGKRCDAVQHPVLAGRAQAILDAAAMDQGDNIAA